MVYGEEGKRFFMKIVKFYKCGIKFFLQKNCFITFIERRQLHVDIKDDIDLSLLLIQLNLETYISILL